jgi:hypothetical protein
VQDYVVTSSTHSISGYRDAQGELVFSSESMAGTFDELSQLVQETLDALGSAMALFVLDVRPDSFEGDVMHFTFRITHGTEFDIEGEYLGINYLENGQYSAFPPGTSVLNYVNDNIQGTGYFGLFQCEGCILTDIWPDLDDFLALTTSAQDNFGLDNFGDQIFGATPVDWGGPGLVFVSCNQNAQISGSDMNGYIDRIWDHLQANPYSPPETDLIVLELRDIDTQQICDGQDYPLLPQYTYAHYWYHRYGRVLHPH